MSTITNEQQALIASKLATMQLPSGLGDEHSACSIAAINLALYGKLTDEIPDCMSRVIGRWVIAVQDAMPSALRNSARWKSLLPLAAGTGREQEQERLDIILDWMWVTVLPSLQPLADQQGFGEQWQKMTTERTVEAATAAANAAIEAATAVEAANAAATATAVEAATAMEAWGAEAATAVEAATWAVRVARAARAAGVADDVWANFDPCGLLERLIKIDNNAQEAV
jgi:hypothetical protein